MNRLPIVFMLLCIASCSPAINTTYYTPKKDITPVPLDEVIVLDDILEPVDTSLLIGQLEIKDSGFTTNCTYLEVIRVLKQKSAGLGGNAVIITEHQPPDFFSTCHRIKADVYLLNNPKDYLRTIVWEPDARLTINDFKGEIENRPFDAATYSYIGIEVLPITNRTFGVKTYAMFERKKSYFKPLADSINLLEHEQLHFDIAEIFARKLIKEIDDNISSYKELEQTHTELLNKVTDQMALFQDKYDSEVYQNPELQANWNEVVKLTLDSLNDYEQKAIIRTGGRPY
jgi:hypothetical protein